ncbi:DUF1385 domain-containing protein [Brochothrix campestris]|uniref:DUF1385 domain-containing protein n=1 Tax=Brochothrix campestris FSL F6-1037 TaxID=1265861 RepID=W7CVB7_9LIST|nr:DUF1385 domain-containing protein [Brochothrix campestris]EUJ40640.1 hypothetical protein BCAMP_04582 [Brochothrix campestris FSL F6-1037]
MEPKSVYGGQAVVEGVMFGTGKHTVTAVRLPDDSLTYYYLERQSPNWARRLKKIPFVRGIIALIESTKVGGKHLTFSAEQQEVDEVAPEKSRSKLIDTGVYVLVALLGIITFLFAKFALTLIPVFIAGILKPIFPGHATQIILESVFKLSLLVGYLLIVSQTKLIKTIFQYHGSEHKVINCYESGQAMTVANVQKATRLHYRCGSSFILFTVIIGMFVYFFFPTDPFWLRLLSRILLIPVVMGISFEVLQATNKCRQLPLLKYLGYPGLWLQLLTTKEPTDKQVEVALASFEALRAIEKQPSLLKTDERFQKTGAVNDQPLTN